MNNYDYLKIPISKLTDFVGKAKAFHDTLETEDQKDTFKDFIESLALLFQPFTYVEEKCEHPGKCHECDKILTCTYYKENNK